MSTINTATIKIDILYPVAGEENSSQGFRDNFANIKTALYETYLEVKELQETAVLKSDLLGIGANNVMSGSDSPISNVVLRNNGYSTLLGQTLSAISSDIDFSVGAYQEFIISNNITFRVINWRPAGEYGIIRLSIKNNDILNDKIITFAAALGGTVMLDGNTMIGGNNTRIWDVWSVDGGLTVYAHAVGSTFGPA
jgi:hypothetical protein